MGLVSFWNDAASEMLTPLLPVFLTATLGAGPTVVGLVEGVAEATASLLKLVSGHLADRGWGSKGLVLGGYGLSNAARPLIALAPGWGAVLGLRFADRIGKGLRTAPRDALIAADSADGRHGVAFGFQRAMDHGGAMLGPLLAFALLQAGLPLREVFLCSAIPGAIVILLLVFALPRRDAAPRPAAPPPLRWRALDPRMRALVVASAALAFAAVPEVFLVLWARERGIDLVLIPLIWATASGLKAVVAGAAGALSDALGRMPVVLGGWSARVAVLGALAVAGDGALGTWTLFLAWAAALASTEGAERALVGELAPAAQRATAFGLYHLTAGLAALPGALLFGALWEAWGSA
ncbi:MAG TPA: MFS transporter, partial [Myxococcota bacterium]|nr:MFS transporter [Myxococcota bacterium]